jgi:hypothetical protein
MIRLRPDPQLTLDLSPGATGEVWVLEDATYGALGEFPLAY